MDAFVVNLDCDGDWLGCRENPTHGFQVSATHAVLSFAFLTACRRSTWNLYGCRVDATILRDTATAMVKSGLKDAGYIYVNRQVGNKTDGIWS